MSAQPFTIDERRRLAELLLVRRVPLDPSLGLGGDELVFVCVNQHQKFGHGSLVPR